MTYLYRGRPDLFALNDEIMADRERGSQDEPPRKMTGNINAAAYARAGKELAAVRARLQAQKA